MPPAPPILHRPWSALRAFLRGEAAGGFVLVASAGLALVAANSPWASFYGRALSAPLAGLSLLHWINDGLMALFFLLVGLEIKRELVDGQLRSWPDRALPGLAALGGMVVPALIYAVINAASPDMLRGAAIPVATDIAFALAVVALFGRRVPLSLKVFLTALAILDDLGAILVIAVFYTADLSLPMLAGAAGAFALLLAMNRRGVDTLAPYLLVGGLLWFLVLRSGIHATVAGVLLALAIPLRRSPGRPDDAASPLHRLEHGLSSWIAFLVLPVFGFANAGVSLAGFSPAVLGHPVTLGIALGLFLGKQAGVFGTLRLAVRLRLAPRPAGAGWLQVYGVSLLCGVGFTMSLFIGLLAFPASAALETEVKIGVLAGSLLSMAAGALVLGLAKPQRADGSTSRREDAALSPLPPP